MWRYLPPAVLCVCSGLVLIAGATGDLQSWSASVDTLPPWRTVVASLPLAPVTEAWDAGMARLRPKPATTPDTEPPLSSAPAGPAAAPGGAGQQSARDPLPAPPPQTSVAQAATVLATAPQTKPITEATSAPPPARPPAQPQAAASPLQQRLISAREALVAGHAAEAQKLLETAKSQMPVRSGRESNAAQVDMSATWVGRALLSLKSGDSTGALHDLDLAIASS